MLCQPKVSKMFGEINDFKSVEELLKNIEFCC